MNVNTIRRVTIGLSVGLLFFVLAAHTAAAAPAVDRITLSPVDRHYKLAAGEAISDEFTVINDGTSNYSFAVYARPYSIAKNDESYSPNFFTDAKNADVYQWVQFDKPSYSLKAGQSVKVKFTLRVSENATPGGHYGVLFAETQPIGKNSGSTLIRKKRLGMIVYATVKGVFTTKGSSEPIQLPSFLQTRPPLSASQRVSNEGNSDFSVRTTFRVYDAFGGKKFEQVKDYSVLPDTTRKVAMEWQNASWFGLYKVEASTLYLGKTAKTSGYVLLAPLWMYIILTAIIAMRVYYALQQRKKMAEKKSR
ncbi:hypothetical protein KBD87_02245 [Candidatus Saccharibacteria bacterium]|nr:hypothetical protein [Candidatus Saccharibacteria bacterium]